MSAPFRSPKLLAAAKGQQCTLKIPGVCVGGTETVVACHSPLGEDRKGAKAPDFCVAWGCAACHDVLDRRKSFTFGNYTPGLITIEDQRYFFHRGLVSTLAMLFEKGIVKV